MSPQNMLTEFLCNQSVKNIFFHARQRRPTIRQMDDNERNGTKKIDVLFRLFRSNIRSVCEFLNEFIKRNGIFFHQ